MSKPAVEREHRFASTRLLESAEREALRLRSRSAKHSGNARLAALLLELVRYARDRDHALAERVHDRAQAMARTELRARAA